MAGSKSAYLETALLQHVLGKVTYTAPATLYIALSTAPFDTSATGSAMTEVSGGSYARVSVANNTTNFPAPTGSNPTTLGTGVTINFPIATADWGVVESVYVVDAASAGNCLYGADVPTPVDVATGSSISVPSGAFIFLDT